MTEQRKLWQLEDPWSWLAGAPDHAIPLEQAALLVCRDEYPMLDVDAYLARLALHEEELRRQFEATPAQAMLAKVAGLNRYLFDDQGYVGESLDYYDPRNSYLSDVLDRRRGIPISLSLLYLHLARRLQLPAQGVSFPGHFLVRLPVDDGLIVLDPYHGGRSLDTEELRQRAWSAQAGERPDDDALIEMLEPTDNRSILARMLRNLKSIYIDQEDWSRALRVADRLVLLLGQAEEHRDRALLYRAVGADAAALTDLRRYVAMRPEAAEDEGVRQLLGELAGAARRLH